MRFLTKKTFKAPPTAEVQALMPAGPAPAAAALRRILSETLPDYMVPSASSVSLITFI